VEFERREIAWPPEHLRRAHCGNFVALSLRSGHKWYVWPSRPHLLRWSGYRIVGQRHIDHMDMQWHQGWIERAMSGFEYPHW
jgi:hypothetical protein